MSVNPRAFARSYTVPRTRACGAADDTRVVTSTVGGSGNLGQTGGYVRVESNDVLQKTGSGTFTLHNARVINNGQIQLFDDAGTIALAKTGAGTE